ncbi:MAG TPA: hypothetical protein VIH59_36765, partial [Candidatus Tectomicrobia bacterium]
WTVWAMHVQMMSMRIDCIANRAAQDNANVKAAVWPVRMMVSQAMRPYLVWMMVSYAMWPYLGRRSVVLSPLLV